jgi:aminoglycoside phosphotransferase (APT) family kinase protein
LLHAIPVGESSKQFLRSQGPDSFEKWIGRAVDRGVLTSAQSDDVLRSLERWTQIGGPLPELRLIHNDIHPWNLMGDPDSGSLTAILDWGDASIGDPARDFAMMPLQCVPLMLEGYAEAGGESGPGIAARALIVGVSTALFELSTPEMEAFDRKWWRMPPGGWDEMKALAEELWPEIS